MASATEADSAVDPEAADEVASMAAEEGEADSAVAEVRTP